MITDKAGNSFENIILIVWGILAPVITGIVGYFGKRWHIRYHVKQERLRSALDNFIHAFTPTIARIENAPNVESTYRIIMTILSEHRVMHKQAIVEFRSFLSKENSFALDKAWTELSCEDYTERNLPRYYNYSKLAPNEAKEEALQNINAVTKFAKNKF